VRQRRLDLELAGLPTPALLTRIGAAVHMDQALVPTLTGVLFFAPDPQRFYPSLTITFLHFAGTTTAPADPDTPFYLDNREFRGPIPAMIEATRAAVFQRIGRRAIVTGFRRQEVPDYPDVATREAIINAVAHRDYSRLGSFIQVRLFTDRIEVQSPGGLAAGLTVENLVYEQHTRNPHIMRLLEDLGYVERRGVGIDTMIAAMASAGLPPPEFEDRRTSFWVILRGPTGARTTAEYVRMGLNERQIQAIGVLHERGRLTNRDYQELFHVSERTALYDLSDLVERGIALPVSSGRGRYYILRD
jgi:ATP-dependent DNA helicase RecG